LEGLVEDIPEVAIVATTDSGSMTQEVFYQEFVKNFIVALP
jgi:hypothetical protein